MAQRGGSLNRVLSFTAVGLGGLLAGAVVLVYFPEFSPFESRFITACETSLKDTLKAPSTYKRIKITRADKRIPLAVYYVGREVTAVEMEFNARQHSDALRAVAYIEYDAANSFGTPLRGGVECSYETLYGDESGASEFSVKIDGKTKTDRLIEAIKAAR